MSIPGLGALPGGIPGLTLTSNPLLSDLVPAAPRSRTISLSPNTEWRFETSFSNAPIQVKLTSGNAELFGTELAPGLTYTFKGTKAAVYTWQGAQLEVTGEVEADYVAEETPMSVYANLHFALENMRHQDGAGTPRVLLVGPENSGKTSLIKILTAYAVKSGRQPTVVNLDPRQGMLSIPGALTASAVSSMLDVEDATGWGCSPVSGPTARPVKMPLVYHYGCATPEENAKLYKGLVTRLGLAVKARMEEDDAVKASGILIDTPGSLAVDKSGKYELIQHAISDFAINVLLILGSERLFNDLKSRVASSSPSTTVLRIDKSGGCVDRDEAYMTQLRQAQIREYFFGDSAMSLGPHSMLADFANLTIYKIASSSSASAAPSNPSANFNIGAAANDDEDDFYEPSATIPTLSTSASAPTSVLDKVQPSNQMTNSLLAVTFASANASPEQVRDAAVMGYVYVAEVDEAKRKVKLLSPGGGQPPREAMVWGGWPEGVAGLVS